jgi:hypothetical protein
LLETAVTKSSFSPDIGGIMTRTMTRFLQLAALALVVACMAWAQSPTPDVVGDWQGALDTGQGQLRLVLHLTKAADGSLAATIDSLDQGANAIPVSSVTLKASKLSLGVDAVNGSYEGTVNADASEIDGTWTQGQGLPLNFKRAAAAPAKPADQKPAKPQGN